ncbi:IS110 family transposase [Natronosporangium hydrolyticum]|nr:IS110 family transposase [Natronosporangium hydrolyticum]
MRLCVGDDWAKDHHDIEVINEVGKVLVRSGYLKGSRESGNRTS